MDFFEKRRLLTILLAIILAYLLAFFLENGVKLWIALAALVLLIPFCFFRKTRLPLCLILIPFALALLNHFLFVQYSYLPMAELQGEKIEIQGRTKSEHKLSENSSYFVVDADAIFFEGELRRVSGDVIVYCDPYSRRIPVGTYVACYGTAFEDDENFSLNYRATVKQFLSVYAKQYRVLETASKWDINGLAARARETMRGVFDDVFDDRAYALVCGLLLGERDLIDDETHVSFKSSGVAHTLAVSGMHLAFLTTILWFLLSAICPNLRLRAFFQLILIWSFAALTGFSPSCCRAAIMLTVYQIGIMVDKESDSLTALSLAVVVCCLTNPFAILNPSLALSASSTAGLLLLGGPLMRLFPTVSGHGFVARLLRFVFQTAAMSVAATIATLPVMSAIFGSVSLFSPITNILIIPAIEALFILGVIAAATFWCPPIAFVLRYLGEGLAIFCKVVTGAIARLPYSVVPTDRAEFWIILFCCSAVIAVLFFFLRNKSKLILPCCLLLGIVVLSGCIVTDFFHRDEILVSVVDVEQGNTVILRNGYQAVLVDCGGSGLGYSSIECELLYNNIKKIKSIFVTHLDADHLLYGERLIRTYSVDTLYLPRRSEYKASAKALMHAAFERGTEVVLIGEERNFDLWGLAELSVFTGHIDWNSDEENENSLVFQLDYKDTEFLFTGDVRGDGEQRLAERYRQRLSSEVLLVAHHGATKSSTDAFMKYVSPDVSVISVGRDNNYNLPNDMVVRRLMKYSSVLRTDWAGTIRFVVDGEGYRRKE